MIGRRGSRRRSGSGDHLEGWDCVSLLLQKSDVMAYSKGGSKARFPLRAMHFGGLGSLGAMRVNESRRPLPFVTRNGAGISWFSFEERQRSSGFAAIFPSTRLRILAKERGGRGLMRAFSGL